MKPGGRRIPDFHETPLPASPQLQAHPAPAQGTNAAILKLLGDEDTSTVRLVMEQLLADPGTALPRIESLLQEASASDETGPAAKELRRALRELRRGDRFVALRRRCARIETLEEFEAFCWELALCADPDAPIGAARERLDAWAASVREELPSRESDLSRLEALRTVLAEEGGLRGNADDYYDPRNSFLDRVILSGRGIPISLTAVYLFVGARAGIAVDPIGMPGHFLARIGNLYLDPFHEGLAVDGEALREMVKRSATAANAPEEARHALHALSHPMPLALMARRMVVNLVNIYEEREGEEEKATSARWRDVLRWIEEGLEPHPGTPRKGKSRPPQQQDDEGNEEGDML